MVRTRFAAASRGFFFYQPLSVRGWTSAFLLTVHRLWVSLRGDWASFYNAGSGRVGRVWSAREKSLEILRRGWELNPGHGEDRQWAIPLSYHDCRGLEAQKSQWCWQKEHPTNSLLSFNKVSLLTREQTPRPRTGIGNGSKILHG